MKNCSTVSITWDKPIHDSTLVIYDDVNDTLINNVSVKDTTSYQFVEKDLFRHRYKYLIFGSNELGEGDYSAKTFSYQRG